MATLSLKKSKEEKIQKEEKPKNIKSKKTRQILLWMKLKEFDAWNNRLPLKIGIQKDFFTLFGDKHSRKVVRAVLRSRTRTLNYLRNVAKGGNRYTLEGEVSGVISDKDREYARKEAVEVEKKLASLTPKSKR